jgi:hypothetical protein
VLSFHPLTNIFVGFVGFTAVTVKGVLRAAFFRNMHSVAGRIRSVEKSNHIGYRIRDLPACNYDTACPRLLQQSMQLLKLSRIKCVDSDEWVLEVHVDLFKWSKCFSCEC